MGKNSKQLRKNSLRAELESRRPENMRHPEERLLPQEFLESVRENGLDIGDFPNFESAHAVYPSGYSINLPQCSGGNRISEFECYFIDYRGHEQVSHMPSLTLWGEAGNWNAQVWNYVPRPGPGDFMKRFVSLDDVLKCILSYFFDPKDDHFRERCEQQPSLGNLI